MSLLYPFVPFCNAYYGRWEFNGTTCEPALAKMPRSDALEVYGVNSARPVGPYNLPVTYDDIDCKLKTPLSPGRQDTQER